MRHAAIVVILGLLVFMGPSAVRVSTHDRDMDRDRYHGQVDAPFQALQREIEALQAQLAALSTQSTPATSLIVVDSTGAKMGRVLGVNTGVHTTVVGFEANGKVYPFDLERNDYEGTPLYFVSADCSGQAYFVPTYSPLPATALSLPGDVLYGEDGPSQTLTLHSLSSGGACYGTGSTLTVVPVDVVANLGSMFVPPFSVVEGQ
jgi:hypothetical protein